MLKGLVQDAVSRTGGTSKTVVEIEEELRRVVLIVALVQNLGEKLGKSYTLPSAPPGR